MTVGISITNGKEAIVITDSRVSGKYRQSDSVNKMNSFLRENYNGVIFGSGRGNDIFGILDNIDQIQEETFEKFIESAHTIYQSQIDNEFKNTMNVLQKDILAQSEIIPSEKNKEIYLDRNIDELIKNISRKKDERRKDTLFAVTGYDHKLDKIVSFGFNSFEHYHYNITHGEIGSGSDGAQLYLGTKLQGINPTKLTTTELLFFALNAYSNATMNEGVGGTPKIAKIIKSKVEIFSIDKTIFLTNISGAHLSDHPDYKLNTKKAINIFKEVLEMETPNYSKINKFFTGDPISSQIISPYSSWQESANRKLLNK